MVEAEQLKYIDPLLRRDSTTAVDVQPIAYIILIDHFITVSKNVE
jgi:hypothetical protein